MNAASLLAVLAVGLGGLSASELAAKVWIPNTNFGNPGNWNLKRVPCDMDRVFFPLGLDLEVALPEGRTALRELVLSLNGELLLPTNGALDFGGATQETSSCVGQDIRFTRSGAKSWLDPANWRTSAAQNDAVPHVERVPCRHDVVQFDAGASVKIQLPDVDLVVGKIRFGDHDMSGSEWLEWLESDAGFRQLLGHWDARSTSLTAQPAAAWRCASKAGCACHGGGVDALRIFEQVCRFEAPRCPTPGCYRPVTPHGHCCPVCGAVLDVKHDAQFDQDTLDELIDEYTADPKYAGVVHVHSRKDDDDDDGVQIVIVERGKYQGISNELAAQMADDVLKDMDLGVKKVTIHSAGPMILGSKLASAAETIFGTFFGVLFVMAAIFYVFVVYKKGRGASNYQLFQFARFENVGVGVGEEGEEEAVLAIGRGRAPSGNIDASASKAFDNPLYGATSASRATSPPDEDAEESNEGSSVTHRNPIYSELRKREEHAKKEDKKDDDDDDETESDEDSAADSDVESILDCKSEGETTFHEVSFKGE